MTNVLTPGDVHVFPCDTNKRPLTEHGLLDATNDPVIFAAWWERWPGANMAIALGKSGLVAVDAEGLIKHGVDGCAGWDRLKHELGFSDEGAWLQDTPSGGCHYVFSDPDGQIQPANDAKLGGRGYELRAGGQYIVGPGGFANSQGDNGRYSGMYRPLNEWVGCPAPVPTALREYLLRVGGYDSKSQPAAPVGDAIPAGSRNQTLASLAGTMRRRSMAQEAIEAALLAENAARCKPPLPDDEVRSIARSVARYAPTPEAPLPEMPPWMADGQGIEAMTPGDTNTGKTPEIPVHPKPVKALPIISAHDILTTVWPDPPWVVAGLLPVGLTVLAGRPKVGKSWLALQLAQAVATGGRFLDVDVPKGKALYLALEDPPQRLKERMNKQNWPDGGGACDFVSIGGLRELGALNAGGGRALSAAIQENGYNLVLIDTLARALTCDPNDNREVTRALTPLQELAHKLGFALLGIDHHNKLSLQDTEEVDPIGAILGAIAKAGMADNIWGMFRARGKAETLFVVEGREVALQKKGLRFDSVTGCWQLQRADGLIKVTEARRALLQVIEDLGEATCADLADGLGKNKGGIHKELQDLVAAGQVVRTGMIYSLRREE